MSVRVASATLMMAVVTVATGSVSNAAPARAESPAGHAAVANAASGTDHGVGFRVQPVEAGRALVATISGGAFSLGADRWHIAVRNREGRQVASIPLRHSTEGRQVNLGAAISDKGTRLTLRPDATPVLRRQNFRTSLDWWNYELGKAAPSAGIGAIIGAVIGIFFLGIGIIPGALIGAGIGLLVGGGQDLIDAGYAYFGNQP